MLRVALTGGIGSGKSTVANLFAQHGVSIIDADIIAYQLTTTDVSLLTKIQQYFSPSSILDKEGRLNRAQLRQIIFQNPEHKQWLEQLLHPKIRQIMQQEIAHAKPPYCILVIPLLAESKQPIDFIDRICVVQSSSQLQIARASKRDQQTVLHIENIISQQSSLAQRLALADDIITNEGSLGELAKQVDQLHQLYMQLAVK